MYPTSSKQGGRGAVLVYPTSSKHGWGPFWGGGACPRRSSQDQVGVLFNNKFVKVFAAQGPENCLSRFLSLWLREGRVWDEWEEFHVAEHTHWMGNKDFLFWQVGLLSTPLFSSSKYMYRFAKIQMF